MLWNKLYRRDILADHHLQFTSEVRWAEDLVFNLEYILYANVFVSIPKAGYHYVQNPQSICHTQINLASIVQNKLQVFRYYKELYTKLGLYDQVQPQLYKFLTAFSGERLSLRFSPEDHHGHGQPLGLWCSGCFRQGKRNTKPNPMPESPGTKKRAVKAALFCLPFYRSIQLRKASRTAPSRPRGMGMRAPLHICSSPAVSSRAAARLTT